MSTITVKASSDYSIDVLKNVLVIANSVNVFLDLQMDGDLAKVLQINSSSDLELVKKASARLSPSDEKSSSVELSIMNGETLRRVILNVLPTGF
jgi:hypothetical protein